MTDGNELRNSPENDVVEVPVEYRLAHLGIDQTIIYPKVTVEEIAKNLKIDSTPLRRVIKQYGIETELLLHEHMQEYFEHYPFYMIELIREERAWREWYLTLPKQMNTYQVAEAVGRSYGWTAKTLAEIYPNIPQQKKGHKSRFYPRTSAKKLREITFATPPDEGWPTMPMLEKHTGRDREWVLNRIAQTTIRPEMRRQSLTGRDFPHYPPDTFEFLQQAMEQRAQPAGNWLTAHAIKQILERSYNWVTSRLEDTYLHTGEPRLDDMGVERIHYPPSTVSALQIESDELNELKPAGDWVTFRTLRERLGIHGVTLARLAQQVEIESETRLDLLGRPKLHVSPQTQEGLAKKALEVFGYPEADGWLTFSVAQSVINRSAGWIRQQFKGRGIKSEIRLDSSRRPAEHYDPELIAEIKKYGDTLDAGSMVSIDDIVEKTKKSRSWVVARLNSLNAQNEKRFSNHGHFIDHYPDSVVEDILALE